MKDDVYAYNKGRWEALAAADALFTRPLLELNAESAREYLQLERLGLDGDWNGRQVLCLAGGGGQQSAAFALLGADVTVLDISEGQLQRDRQAAERYGVRIKTVQGDMRDLSVLEEGAFDIVWQPYSLNFVPDCRVVFREVSRVIRPGGSYSFMCANPFYSGLTHDAWNGEGYVLKQPYRDEAVVSYPDQEWVYDRSRSEKPIDRPREYCQTLGRMMNGLIAEGFTMTYIQEVSSYYPEAEPGSWGHFTGIAPPWIEYVWRYRS